jgi:hypothetical protein
VPTWKSGPESVLWRISAYCQTSAGSGLLVICLPSACPCPLPIPYALLLLLLYPAFHDAWLHILHCFCVSFHSTPCYCLCLSGSRIFQLFSTFPLLTQIYRGAAKRSSVNPVPSPPFILLFVPFALPFANLLFFWESLLILMCSFNAAILLASFSLRAQVS